MEANGYGSVRSDRLRNQINDDNLLTNGSEGKSPKQGKKSYPFAVFFILSNEFCERFSYYGMRAILVLYLTRWLKFHQDDATSIFHAFSMLSYSMPVIGAILADGFLGRYRTILYLSMVYLLGNVIVSTSAIPPPEWYGPFLGLMLISIGTGGIKSSVAPFGADQFSKGQKKEQNSFFSSFYFMINLGSTISIIVTPILRADVQCFDNDCYSLAFGVPAILMFISLLIFFAGRNLYKKVPPTGNVIGKTFKCIFSGIKGSITKRRYTEKTPHWLYNCGDRFEPEFIEDVRQLLGVLLMFLPLPLFWALSDQQGSRWTLQAEHMDGDIGMFGRLKPDQVQALNPILILVLIPLFDKVIYPIVDKCKIPNRPLQRMVLGLFISCAAFVVAGLVQIKLDNAEDPMLPKDQAGVTFINTRPCSVHVKSIFHTADIPSLEETDFMQHAGGSYLVVMHSSCDAMGKTATYKFEDSRAYRIIIYKDNAGTLQMKQFDDQREKPKNGNAALSIFLAADMETIGASPTHIALVTAGNHDSGMSMIGKHFNVTQGEASNFTEIEPSTYLLYINRENGSDWTDMGIKLSLGVGGVYTACIHGDDSQIQATLFTSVHKNTVSMAWMIPQYVLITVGEVLFSISGLSFAYSQAPASLKSVVQAMWLLTTSFGDLVVIIVANIQAIPSQMAEFFLFAVLMFTDTVIFMLMSLFYTYKPNSLYSELTEDDDDTVKLVGTHSGEEIPLQVKSTENQ